MELSEANRVSLFFRFGCELALQEKLIELYSLTSEAIKSWNGKRNEPENKMTSKTYITKKQSDSQDVVDHFFDNFITGLLTTDHAASSYGQPVIIEGDKLVDYSAIESLTLPYGASDSDLEAARKLESFGIRVSRESVAPTVANA